MDISKIIKDNEISFFLKNDNYYIYNQDIDKIKSLVSQKDIILRNGIREIKLGRCQGEAVIRTILLNMNHKVKEYKEKDGKYVINREGSHSNWASFDDLLLGSEPVPLTGEIRVKKEMVFLKFYNTLNNTLYQTSFEDDDLFSNLYYAVTKLNITEILYSDRKLERILNSMGLFIHYTTSDIVEYLNIKSNYTTSDYIMKNSMRIGKQTLYSLNIYDEGNEMSIFKTFYCFTNQGYRLLHKFFNQPLVDIVEINRRLDYVEVFRDINLYEILKDFPDLIRFVKRCESKRIDVQEIIRLHQVIHKIPKLINILKENNEDILNEEFILPLTNLYMSFESILLKIEELIDFEKAEENEYTYKIESIDLSTKRETLREEIKNEHERLLSINQKIKMEKNENGWVFKLTRLNYKEEEFRKHKFVEISVLKSGVVFTTKRLTELNREYEKIGREIEEHLREVRNEMLCCLNEVLSQIEAYNFIISLIDVFNCLGERSKFSGYSRPYFTTDKSKYIIENSFHPLIRDPVKNSIEFNNETFCVITGPNMGGKSTFIKQCAIISILAQMGCYVPCEKCVLPIFDGIFVRIGASDCTGSSTFMLEMIDISQICRSATQNSLIIIDELGRGTSASDGLSIALAVTEYLIERGCYTFFATHFPEIGRLENTTKILNRRIKTQNDIILYNIEEGICDTSYGINVAILAGFPESTIKIANEFMSANSIIK
ncbi:DNA mismatch repair protein Msh2 [Astathelohania contejeani]|uniref:DNA mismatch repair protein Msh2 n=1 Tax=Astathelohania contejeani TaxID=164912 RepID=A0ABQ7I2B8_9MICR|nr:DNA mismatch repair protein Msh2 [Thelohania contejeani]